MHAIGFVFTNLYICYINKMLPASVSSDRADKTWMPKTDQNRYKTMNKLLMTGLTIMTTLIANAQSIEEQATKAGNEAFANAMIRNVLIIVGVAVVYFLFKLLSKKTDKND